MRAGALWLLAVPLLAVAAADLCGSQPYDPTQYGCVDYSGEGSLALMACAPPRSDSRGISHPVCP